MDRDRCNKVEDNAEPLTNNGTTKEENTQIKEK